MAGQKFEYDESGSTFFYFLISVLGLILLPSTFYFVPSDVEEEPPSAKRKLKCNCTECQVKLVRLASKKSKWNGPKKTIQRVVILSGWILVAVLIYKVQQFDYEYANFDPYDILGVGLQASSAEIKKAYRKQSLIYHPDKTTGDERKFMKLNKAYQALTDPVARKNYELYGNPDGPGAMHFGIALPSWIVEKENSIWVLGLYTLVFMFGLPTVVGIWWYKSSKFSADQVLLDTTQLYYFFFHKTPSMMYKRALMVLSASFEFERGHNSAIIDRESDNYEVPAMFKHLPHVAEKNKERPLCFAYSVKARVLLQAHLSRIQMNPETLDGDRLYLLHCCPTLIQEMVNCVAQLIMLAHAKRISRRPTLETIENVMKLSPTIVQGLWESQNPLLQLPHLTDATLRHCVVRGRTMRSIQQFVAVSASDRKHMLKTFTPEEEMDMLSVCYYFPHVTMQVNYEVVDDDDSGIFTAGAIVTVTVRLVRENSGDVFPLLPSAPTKESKKKNREEEVQKEEQEEEDYEKKLLVDKKKTKWTKEQRQKKKGGKPDKAKASTNTVKRKTEKSTKEETKKEKSSKKNSDKRVEDLSEDSDAEDSQSHSDESEAGDADTECHKEEKSELDEDAEWEKFQKGMVKKEKVLEGQSKTSHSVHCPLFPDDKQEYWWVYVCDRKNKELITVPYYITNLESEEEVQLKMTAPEKPGVYTYQVFLRSDSYVGMEVSKDIRLDVKTARPVATDHPQWQNCSSDEESGGSDDEGAGEGAGGDESEFTTDEEISDISDDDSE